jgi:hypothetical protein
MLKRIAALAGAGALLLSVAVPVLGKCGGGGCKPPMPSDDVTISNFASVYTDIFTKADTGDNKLGGKRVCGGEIKTGAAGAYSTALLDVNSSLVGCPACRGDVRIGNFASIFTDVDTKADTGDNKMGAKCLGGGKIYTSGAEAGSLVDALVNFSVVGYSMP